MAEIKVAFWNLQNLFDTKASDIAADLEFTPENGWTDAVLDNKISNLADVIKLMHGGQKPDLLGICEVESKELLQKLVDAIDGGNYKIAHVDSKDIRGIDASLVYSKDVFQANGTPKAHLIHLRYPTRDIFQVPLKVKANNAEITVFVNHWPSRSRGIHQTEPLRIAVAEHCGRLVDGVLKLSRSEFLALPDNQSSLDALNEKWDQNVLLMGDFNDEPYSRSILEFLKASSGTDNLEEKIKKSSGKKIPTAKSYLGKQAYLFNCMWPLLGIPDEGSYYYSGSTNTMNMLDQFMVSRGLYYGHKNLRIKPGSVEVFRPSIMSTGTKKRPVKFEFSKDGSMSSGYSDHFPIQAVIETV